MSGATFPPRDRLLWCVSDIVDIKPVNMEELTEVITSSEFHPIHCNLFMYSSSKSNIKLADMRDAALCDRHAKSGFLYPSANPRDYAGIVPPLILDAYYPPVISI